MNYIEVRISVEYVGLAMYVYCVHFFELWNICEIDLLIWSCQEFFLSCEVRTAKNARVIIVTVTLKNAIISLNDCRPD